MTSDGMHAAQRGASNGPSARPKRRRPWKLFSAVLFAAVVSVALDEDLRPRAKQGVRAITAGRVYQSGMLSDAELRETARELHLQTVIDLREPSDEGKAIAHEGEVLAALGVEHVRLPSHQVPDSSTVDQFLEVMNDSSHYPVLIHCHHGFGRSVLFSALYRIEFEGWDNEVARRATRHFLRLPWSGFDDEAAKGAFLKSYTPRHRPPLRKAAGAAGGRSAAAY